MFARDARQTQAYKALQLTERLSAFGARSMKTFIQGTYFESIDHFKKELADFLIYYQTTSSNKGGQTPEKVAKNLRRMM